MNNFYLRLDLDRFIGNLKSHIFTSTNKMPNVQQLLVNEGNEDTQVVRYKSVLVILLFLIAVIIGAIIHNILRTVIPEGYSVLASIVAGLFVGLMCSIIIKKVKSNNEIDRRK